ncbi:MAG TPA: hypothetical protein VFC39_07535 [Acidobacteriaceae bacterium]|nr:hypothetical protein [Acidobacteriaceae bacterium]
MNTPTGDSVKSDKHPIEVKAKVRFIDNWHSFVTAVAPVLTVGSFVVGFLFSAHQAKQTADETRAAQWREALQKVTFDEPSLVSTAFIMETFDDDDDFKSSARQIERTILYQTERPETFDLVFFNMLSNLQDAGDVNDTLQVGSSIQERLTQLWQAAVKSGLKGAEPQTFDYFIRKPARFYSPVTQSAQLNRVYVLLWQWDSFSHGIACFFDRTDNECPHPALTGVRFDTVTIVQQESPVKAPATTALKVVAACEVDRDQALGTFYCKNDTDDSVGQ